MNRYNRTKHQTLRIILFLLFSGVSITLILGFTVTDETVEAFKRIQLRSLATIITVWFLFIFADGSATFFFAWGSEHRLSLFTSIKTVFIRILFALITPFNFGGQPFMIYYLSKEGVPPGKATSIVITKLLMLSVFVLLATAVAMFLGRNTVTELKSLNYLFYFTGILQIVVMLLIIFSLLHPHFLVGLIVNIGKISSRIRKNRETRGRFRKKLIREAYIARKSFRTYFKFQFHYFILGTISGGVQYAAQIFLLYTVLHALLPSIPLLEGYVLSALLLFLLSFMPTPGASGLGEMLFVVFFDQSIPLHMLGIGVVMWRFFFNYIGAVFGVIISANRFTRVLFHRKTAKE